MVRMVKPVGASIRIEKDAEAKRGGRGLFGRNARSNRRSIIINVQGFGAVVPQAFCTFRKFIA